MRGPLGQRVNLKTRPPVAAGGPGVVTTGPPQMLVRFRADVVALRPRIVHILAGTNDVAGNTGPYIPFWLHVE